MHFDLARPPKWVEKILSDVVEDPEDEEPKDKEPEDEEPEMSMASVSAAETAKEPPGPEPINPIGSSSEQASQSSLFAQEKSETPRTFTLLLIARGELSKKGGVM